MRSGSILVSLSVLLLLLQACGGGGGGDGTPNVNVPSYSGTTSQALIETGSSRDLGTAAASGALQSVVADSASDVVLARPGPKLEQKLVEISPKIAQAIIQSAISYGAKQYNQSAACTEGGTAIVDVNDAETAGTATFNGCGVNDGAGGVIVLTGTVDFTIDVDANSMSLVFHLSVSYAGEQADINMALSCVNLNSFPSCSYSSDFTGLDDRVYRVEDVTLSGSAASGYYVSATLYDPDHGYVTMTTDTPLTFDCPTGVPGTGSVSLSGASGTLATVTFVSCDEFNVTVDGVAETFYW